MILCHLTEIGDADGHISEGSVLNDQGEMLLVQSGDDLECRAHDAFWSMDKRTAITGSYSANVPVGTLAAEKNTPDIVL